MYEPARQKMIVSLGQEKIPPAHSSVCLLDKWVNTHHTTKKERYQLNVADVFSSYLSKLPNVIIALLVLLIGWAIAKIIEKAVYKGLSKTKIDDKLFAGKKPSRYSSEKVISKVVYFIALIIVFILFFNILHLTTVASPFVSMLSAIAAAIPSVLKAGLILLLGWAAASVLSFLVKKIGMKLNTSDKLRKWNLVSEGKDIHQAVNTASQIVFYLVLLVFLPGVLSSLKISGISGPFTNMMESVLAFLPKLFAAALIVLIGWLVARLVRDIITNFLASIGTERFAARMGLSIYLKDTSLSAVIGTIAYVLIMIPVVISALDQLDVAGISKPAVSMLNTILNMLPNIIIAIVLVLAGIWAGKWVKSMVSGLLHRAGFDSVLGKMGMEAGTPAKLSLSQVVGMIAQIIVILLFTAEALQIVRLHFLVEIATGIIAYLPNVLVAVFILGLGLYAGELVRKVLSSMIKGQEFKSLAPIAKYTIIALAFFMALDQLGVAATIVNSAFIIVLSGFALAFGLSFGLGGKDFASRYLSTFERKMQNTEIEKNRKNQNPSNDM
ncbi:MULTISPECIES: mechanosensitive ion channel [Bacillus]|uniref:mechanosensitive ion channel n=1 Tax=Bacillus sp. C15(2022) TaxID=2968456 RepID=UPI0009B2D0FC|nr:mechanosensitive ion channel [Bacillus subtilis]QKJ77018.1 mechanosensitive ion channel [Bacillus subtilis]